MQCEQAREQLNALADDELAEAIASRVGRHLVECGACQEEWDRICALGERARAWRDVCAPPDLRGRIAAALWISDAAGCGDAASPDGSGMSALRAFLAQGGDDGTKGTES